MKRIEIKNRVTGCVLHTVEVEDEDPYRRGASLIGADLSDGNPPWPNLRGANLRGADLRGADLRGGTGGADLRGADLSGANLIGADLTGLAPIGASFRGASLIGADLFGATLCADFRGADFRGANLRGVTLTGADLRGANLAPIRDDLFAVLSASPREVVGLLESLLAGKFNGSAYEGECVGLEETLARVRGCDYSSLETDLFRPARRFFMLIRERDKPSNSEPCRIAAEWIEEWLTRMREAFGENYGYEE
jgi:hypothetical protein